ncbi:rhodanese-like domain-containing protein, partial [Akkermansiaceae bacterium]|nr:rhodanese-like domain-containing protein [Akkermansiaceae bacterium]
MRYKLVNVQQNLQEFDLIIDARSPSEYAIDHITGAVNLPVLDDAQREQIGTLYKENTFAASRLGAALVAENIASHLTDALATYPKNSTMAVYCWRGNQRSNSF